MGLFKNVAKNRNQFKLNVAAKKAKKIFKKSSAKKKAADGLDIEKIAEAVATEQESPVEEMMVASQGGEEKKVPFVKEGKLRRTALPLVVPTKNRGNERSDKHKPKKNTTSVKFQRPLTKKKARKLMRDASRDERAKAREETKMQE